MVDCNYQGNMNMTALRSQAEEWERAVYGAVLDVKYVLTSLLTTLALP